MRKGITWVLLAILVIQLCILPGCSGNNKNTDPATSETDAKAETSGREIIREELGLSEIEAVSLEATDIRKYEDETVVRYTQSYQGVEIYGSSIIAAFGDEPYCAGTYYDLTEAFGDDFEKLVQQAEKTPA